MIWQEKILKCPFHRYAINKIPIYPNYIINSSQSQTSIGPKIIPDNKFIISNHSLNDRIEGQNIYKINIPCNSNNSSYQLAYSIVYLISTLLDPPQKILLTSKLVLGVPQP